LKAALSLPLRLHGDVSLHRWAVDLAERFSLPAAYDAHYLALAEWLGGEFWTADRRLAQAVGYTWWRVERDLGPVREGQMTDIQLQRELHGPSPLLDDQGNLVQVGWARQPVLDCNLEAAVSRCWIATWRLPASTRSAPSNASASSAGITTA